ncbi:MAG: 4-alpha-glucanotransferase [Lachnospiraceae bacterium]|nr:4-alpha-glucanotransferase [Lachnospiraceae bacterium]
MKKKRAAGILMPVSSLPSPYGIGTLGANAYEFIDQLKQAGQSYWQVLPVGPTSFGDSPYQSFSAFAGNPYFIDLDILKEEGLLLQEEIDAYRWGDDEENVDYAILYDNRFPLLHKAYERSGHQGSADFALFEQESKYWLEDYSFYMALKFYFQGKEWSLWEKELRFRKKDALQKYRQLLGEEIGFWKFCQYHFFKQWKKLKKYANDNGIRIIGDIPLYVALDSADVWTHSDLFELDERRKPIHVAGVPPDIFSEDGQRWGNPLYRWKRMRKDNYHWWYQRMKANAGLYDVIRIDHFIGIVHYWSIPASCPTAVEGEWRKGPGKKLTKVIRKATKGSDIIAEDLGIVSPAVRKLITETGWPGMKILQFAFDGDAENEYLPHKFENSNCLVYGGTHDNQTLMGYYGDKKKKDLKFLMNYLHIKHVEQIPKAMLRAAYGSIADTVIFQMQDILELDDAARMNEPSTVGKNWRWRMKPGAFTEKDVKRLKKYCKTYGR